MKNHTVTWLHLSDLHICQPKTGWDAARVLEKLRDDLLHMQQAHGLQPDLIFFTGGRRGIRSSGKGWRLCYQGTI